MVKTTDGDDHDDVVADSDGDDHIDAGMPVMVYHYLARLSRHYLSL